MIDKGRKITAIIVLAIFAVGIGMAVMPVSADEGRIASVTRGLPDYAKPNGEFNVTLTQSGFFEGVGNVTEVLPGGFEYVDGSYTGHGNVTYNEATRTLTMEFREDISVTYSVTASSYEQTAVFSGRYKAFVLACVRYEEGPVTGDTRVIVDGVPPYTDEHNPAKGATGVPVDTKIAAHVKDNYAVNPYTIEMTVNGNRVWPSIIPADSSPKNWVVTYSPSVPFGYNEVVHVTIDASDDAGNVMPTDSYSFTTLEPEYGVYLTVTPEGQTVAPNVNATYKLTVKNTGNIVDSYTLNVDNINGADVAELNRTTIANLDPGATAGALLDVSDATEGTYIVNVTATSQGDPSKSDMVMTKTIVHLELPDLIVTAIEPNCGYLFANENNNISVTIKNNGTVAAGPFTVTVTADGFSEDFDVPGLAAGASIEKSVTDTTSRTAGDSVTITAAIVGGKSNSTTVTVMNNGYKGKRYTGGSDITTLQTHTLNGNVLYSIGDSYYLSGYSTAWNTYTANWTASDLPVPDGATIEKARLYVYYTWDTVNGMPDNVSLTFNGNLTTRDAFYTDRKGYGGYDNPSGMLAYDVTDDFNAGSDNTAVLDNLNPVAGNPSIQGMVLMVIYEDSSEPMRTIWINEECDILAAKDSYCVDSEEATAFALFTGTGPIDIGASAKLITVAPQADEGDDKNRLYFNDGEWHGIWDSYAGSTQLGIAETDVKAYIKATDNIARFQSHMPAGETAGDYMEASNAILVVESIKPEYNFTIDFFTGYNMISMPLNDATITDAASLAAKIGGDCTQISKWDAVNQTYVTYLPALGVKNFDIAGGEGYEVVLTDPATVIFNGTGWGSPFTISLLTSYNMIGIPVNDTSVPDAASLATKIGGDCTQISKWDAVNQTYVTYLPALGVKNFDIAGGEGYEVVMTGPTSVIFEGKAWSD